MGEPYKSGVELMSFHTVSKVSLLCVVQQAAGYSVVVCMSWGAVQR
jgi:hypothetical protein